MVQDINICGCLHCGILMSTSEIYEWTTDKDPQAAICPYCGVNSILIKISGNKVTKELMAELNKKITLNLVERNDEELVKLTRKE